ncbi:MAG: site-specific DNA-methyltransferase, partial [Pseudanabaena sp. CAN_BIN31]|nr:site-specific DNA-methyltransferase [Pseudanabaena sp. CAN_BIN31]
MDGKSLDVTDEKLEQLKDLFPDIFSEGKIDLLRLRQSLGEEVFVQNEHYELSWAGKGEARKQIQNQTTATMIPDHVGSVNFGDTQNVFIEGENLEVLRVLQKSYFG